MHEAPDPLYWPVYWAIVVIWVAYGLTFLARVPRPDKRQRVRSNGSLLGIVLASAGFPIVWTIRRPTSSPLLTAAPALSYAIETAAVVTGIASVWLTLASIRTLGKQWNLRAAIVNDHALVTTGPYAHVRNPMYLSMLGIMVATGIASATWLALAVAMLLGIVGTMIRIHFEERLLVDAFGAAFDAYRARVPALFPRL